MQYVNIKLKSEGKKKGNGVPSLVMVTGFMGKSRVPVFHQFSSVLLDSWCNPNIKKKAQKPRKIQ